MKGALFVGFVVFCSLWAFGSFLQCSECSSTTSYNDCQSKETTTSCSAGNQSCFQVEVQFVKKNNESDKLIHFSKGCVGTDLCETYNKGEIGQCVSLKNAGYTGSCKGKCCAGNVCNNGNLLSTTNKGAAFVISVMVLFSGLLLTLVNVN